MKHRDPYVIKAMAGLREHFHCLGHCQMMMRILDTMGLIKSEFSRVFVDLYKRQRGATRFSKEEQAVWQRRLWGHKIRDERVLLSIWMTSNLIQRVVGL